MASWSTRKLQRQISLKLLGVAKQTTRSGSGRNANGTLSVYTSTIVAYDRKTNIPSRTQVKVQKVLGWLETNDTLPADILEQKLQDYLPNSCDWFLQHKSTQIWLEDNAKNPFLWLYGKPGAGMFIYRRDLSSAYSLEGKSTICSALVKHAEANSVNVFYYFCSSILINADGQTRRPNRLLRSIISQVIQRHQDLAIYVHDVYFIAHPVPTKKALLSLLPELLRGTGSVRLIIDGIDEWVSQDQRDVLNDLSQIVSTDKSSHLCKILIASRETFEISRSMLKKNKSTTTISLSNDDEGLAISRSIAHFVEIKLSDLPDHFDQLDPDASIMAHVKKTLIEKSHGNLRLKYSLTSCVLKLAQVCSCGSVLYWICSTGCIVLRSYALSSTIFPLILRSFTKSFSLVFVALQVPVVMEGYLVSWA
jgi:hypothetical protein